MTQEAFKAWWYNEGSQAPYTHHDCEEHTKRMCKIAWSNGADVAAQPAQEREWVGLTDEEREGIAKDYSLIGHKSPFKEIEAKLKEKNT